MRKHVVIFLRPFERARGDVPLVSVHERRRKIDFGKPARAHHAAFEIERELLVRIDDRFMRRIGKRRIVIALGIARLVIVKMRGGELDLPHLVKVAVTLVAVIEALREVVALADIIHIRGVVHPDIVRPFQKPRRTMRIGGDVQADVGTDAADMFESLAPLLPKKGVKRLSAPFRRGMTVTARAAGLDGKAVYLEIFDVIVAAKIRHAGAEIGDIFFIARADVAREHVHGIAYFAEQARILGRLRRVTAARTEPDPEKRTERARQLRLRAEAVFELLIKLPEKRLFIFRPTVVDHIAVERTQPRLFEPLIDGGERAFDILRVYVEHIVIPAVELYAEFFGTRKGADIGEKGAPHLLESRLFSRADDDGRQTIDSPVRHFGKIPARMIFHAYPAA